MDQRTLECLLRRLVERVEDSERRYGEALDELHARLDRLSQTAEAARESGAPEDADTFDRLHTQVSNLARRLEVEGSPLDDFERLGQALTGGLRGDFADTAPPAEEPEPSPFAQAAMERTPSRLAPESDYQDYGYAPRYAPRETPGHGNLDRQLVEMAERLERSIGTAMPTGAIEALNSRLDEIGHQLATALGATSRGEALEHVERQISDMGQQLSRAEEQIAKIGGLEEHLLRLIARIEAKDAAPATQPDPAQLQEIAAKAASEAARAVTDDAKRTSERLDTMQRELTAMSDKSRASGDKLQTTIEAVHASLKKLVQQMEQGGPAMAGKIRPPFASQETRAAAPFTQAAQAPAPKADPQKTEAPKPQAPQTHAPQTHAPRLPEMASAPKAPPAAEGKPRTKETLRDRLSASFPDFKETETPPPFGRSKRAGLDEAAVDLDAEMKSGPDDLVAAARRAAQAAAARAEERGGRRTRKPFAGTPPVAEQRGGRKRSLLIISAAILLVISALLLYGRLANKPDAEMTPAPIVETTPEAETNVTPPIEDEGKAENEAAMPGSNDPAPSSEPDRGSWMILPDQDATPGPDFEPFNGRVGQTAPGVTDVAKSSGAKSPGAPMPASEINPEPQLAALKPTGEAALPPGVIFSIEDPDSAPEVALAESMTTAPVKGPMPPKTLGPLGLRKAAADGDAAAQYTIGVRYLEGKGTKPDLTKAAEWLERAARAGLAPAQYRLAAMYERGLGVEKDADKARSWYAAAAERGNVKAMHNLAVSVSGRDGGTPNYALAAKWYGEAAARGLGDSQFNLGILAEHGLGRTKDLSEAYKWFSLAASQGDPEAKKRREMIRVQLAPETLEKADAELKAWTPMPAPVEANEVAEQKSWAAATGPSGQGAPEGSSLVSRAQTLLNKLGYDVGPPDGLIGARTRAGIKQFQQRNGLEQTGEVTVPLVTRLKSLSS